MSYTGSCLCGAVSYAVSGDLGPVFYCHCSQCRKAQGTPFVASMPVPRANFLIKTGADKIKMFRATPDKGRYFCGECGSPLYSQVEGNPMLRLRAGTLDEPVPLQAVAHIFVGSKASWERITDDLPQHSGREPGR